MKHYISNFTEKVIEALEADLKDIKSGISELAIRYTNLLEEDILEGIRVRKEIRTGLK